jgi:hypothetical protein
MLRIGTDEIKFEVVVVMRVDLRCQLDLIEATIKRQEIDESAK